MHVVDMLIECVSQMNTFRRFCQEFARELASCQGWNMLSLSFPAPSISPKNWVSYQGWQALSPLFFDKNSPMNWSAISAGKCSAPPPSPASQNSPTNCPAVRVGKCSVSCATLAENYLHAQKILIQYLPDDIISILVNIFTQQILTCTAVFTCNSQEMTSVSICTKLQQSSICKTLTYL